MLRRRTSILTAECFAACELSFIVSHIYYLRSMSFAWIMSYGDVASERSRGSVVGVN